MSLFSFSLCCHGKKLLCKFLPLLGNCAERFPSSSWALPPPFITCHQYCVKGNLAEHIKAWSVARSAKWRCAAQHTFPLGWLLAGACCPPGEALLLTRKLLAGEPPALPPCLCLTFPPTSAPSFLPGLLQPWDSVLFSLEGITASQGDGGGQLCLCIPGASAQPQIVTALWLGLRSKGWLAGWRAPLHDHHPGGSDRNPLWAHLGKSPGRWRGLRSTPAHLGALLEMLPS